MLEKAEGFAVAVKRAYVDVLFAGPDAVGDVALGEPGVDESTEIFILFVAGLPEGMEGGEDGAGEFEGSPDPVGGGVWGFYLNVVDFGVGVWFELDGVEEFGVGDGEQEEGELIVGEMEEGVFGEPDGVGEADEDLLVRGDEGEGLEEGVAEAGGWGLDGVAGGGRADAGAEVLDDVGFPGGDDEAELGGAGF